MIKITEEFVKHIFYARKTPFEEKVDSLAKGFEILVELILKIPEEFDEKFFKLLQKVDGLESKITELNRLIEITKNQEQTIENVPQPPPSPPPSKKRVLKTNSSSSTGSVRGDLIKELKDMFEHQKKLGKKEE